MEHTFARRRTNPVPLPLSWASPFQTDIALVVVSGSDQARELGADDASPVNISSLRVAGKYSTGVKAAVMRGQPAWNQPLRNQPLRNQPLRNQPLRNQPAWRVSLSKSKTLLSKLKPALNETSLR